MQPGRAPLPARQSRALSVVIGTTLFVGLLLSGVLVVRATIAPTWLMPAAPAPAPCAAPPVAIEVLPPAYPPPPAGLEAPSATSSPSAAPSAAASTSAGPGGSASAIAAASASGKARPPAWKAPAEPEVVELPADFTYSPPQPGNLTLPAAPPSPSPPTQPSR